MPSPSPPWLSGCLRTRLILSKDRFPPCQKYNKSDEPLLSKHGFMKSHRLIARTFAGVLFSAALAPAAW